MRDQHRFKQTNPLGNDMFTRVFCFLVYLGKLDCIFMPINDRVHRFQK